MSKIAFVFPGQGSQYVGMGKEVAENYKVADEVFNTANKCLGIDIKKICFEGPEEELKKTVITQPAVLTTSIALLKVFEHYNIKPDFVAGLSLGEYSALVAANAIDFEDALPLVQKRGRFMQEAVPLGKGTMAAIIGLDKETIHEICEEATRIYGTVEPANYNCPGQIVISGLTEAVKKAIELSLAKGARKAVELPVSAPFHSSLLKPAGERLLKEIQKINFRNPEIPVISNVTADYVYEPDEIKELLVKQVSSPVLWEDSIRKMIADGAEVFVEVGPGRSLSAFVKKIDRRKKVLDVQDIESIEKAKNALKEAV